MLFKRIAHGIKDPPVIEGFTHSKQCIPQVLVGLWTGRTLSGLAVASHVRVSNPLFTHTLYPIYVAIWIWLGFYFYETQNLEVYFRNCR